MGLVIFERSGHLPWYEEPARFLSVIEAFLIVPFGTGDRVAVHQRVAPGAKPGATRWPWYEPA